MRQMPKEGQLFKKQDTMWRDNMVKVQRDVRVLVVADIPNLLESYKEQHEMLELVQKGLNDYVTAPQQRPQTHEPTANPRANRALRSTCLQRLRHGRLIVSRLCLRRIRPSPWPTFAPPALGRCSWR